MGCATCFSTLLSCSYKFLPASISQHSMLARALFLYYCLIEDFPPRIRKRLSCLSGYPIGQFKIEERTTRVCKVNIISKINCLTRKAASKLVILPSLTMFGYKTMKSKLYKINKLKDFSLRSTVAHCLELMVRKECEMQLSIFFLHVRTHP